MNILCFSGGKDSTALILWAEENLDSFNTIFCDTGWEDEQTYNYIDYINEKLLKNKLIKLKSEKYDGFIDLAIKKQRFPSTNARFCTQELKIIPMKNYINQFDNVHLYNGIRAEESFRRSQMDETVYDDYFLAWVHRPLLKWVVKDVLNIIKKYDIELNPLYKQGMSRVGCMPCIMCNHKEMRNIIKNKFDVIEKLIKYENEIGHTFFPPNYIPDWACSMKSDKGTKYPTINDIVKYLQKDKNQQEIFEQP